MDKIKLEFENDYKMIEYLEISLNNGYELISGDKLILKIKRNDRIEELSIRNMMLKDCPIVYPNYDNTFLGVISDIRNSFGYRYSYPLLNYINKRYERIAIIVLDGLGSHILKLLDDNSLLKRTYRHDLSAIYPSTTAAATTSIKTGLSPLETGWCGWQNYFKEINKNLVLFTSRDYFTNEATGFNIFNALPWNAFYKDMNLKGRIIEPDFSKSRIDIADALNRSIQGFLNGDKIQYIYHSEPDGMLHMEGLGNSVLMELKKIDKKIEGYSKLLPKNTLLLSTADHGHTPVTELSFYRYNLFNKMLERRPSNDGRCITFKVKPEYMKDFKDLFSKTFNGVYKLYESSEAIRGGFLGRGIENARIKDFLADYVALGINEIYFNYEGEQCPKFKSHHAGITAKEMIVPLCMLEV